MRAFFELNGVVVSLVLVVSWVGCEPGTVDFGGGGQVPADYGGGGSAAYEGVGAAVDPGAAPSGGASGEGSSVEQSDAGPQASGPGADAGGGQGDSDYEAALGGPSAEVVDAEAASDDGAGAGEGVPTPPPGDGSAPEGHTDNVGGTFHWPGKTDPLSNCVACHGTDLQGGIGTTCYACHDSSSHTVGLGGVMHGPGDVSSCAACHGPADSGGLGPACALCHSNGVPNGGVGEGGAGGGAPSSHTEVLAGVLHMPGQDDPLSNCAACHGSKLQGAFASSCYACHDNADHTVSHGGVMHRTGDQSTCTTCHGPNSTGGLGPACADCHSGGGQSGGGGWVAPAGHTASLGGALHKSGQSDPLKNCVACHGAKLGGGEGPSCYSCHDNKDHTSNRDGAMHKKGSSSTCTACHGPGNGGGLGGACGKCHGKGGGDDDDDE